MSKLSFLEKLKILLEVSNSSFLSIVFVVFLVAIGLVFITTNKENAKKHKIIYLSLVLISTTILVIINFKSLGKIFDYMMNNLFIVIYFPNLAVYFAAIIIMNIILWFSIFSYKTSELIKKLNVIVYTIMNYILVTILRVVSTNKLDVFSQNSIYANKKAAALIELSSNIFMVWIIFLILYKIILIYIRKDYRPKVKKVIVRRKVKMLPENFIPTSVPNYIYGKVGNAKLVTEEFKKPIPEVNTLSLIPDEETIRLTSSVEKKKRILAENKKLTEQFDKMLTVNDYKLLLKMLSEQKNKDKYETIKELEEKKRKEEKRLQQQRIAEEAKLQQKRLVEEVRAKAEAKAKAAAKAEAEKNALEIEKVKKEEAAKRKAIEAEKKAAEAEKKAIEVERKAREKEEKERIEAQKQEIIRLEEERKESLRKEKERIAEIKKQEQLKIEEIKKKELEKEQEKFTELEMLYRSVR